MKVTTITSLLALSTGLTGVVAFPVLTENVNLTVRGGTGLNARDSGKGFLAERAEERKKKHKDPYDCGAPFCARSPEAVAQELEFDPKDKRGEDRKKKLHKDPYDCGAPFCGRSDGATVQELEFDPKDKRDAEAEPSFDVNELTALKRDAEAESIAQATPIHHCWEAPDGQIHCDPQKRDAEAAPIHRCWEAPDGQIHCDPQKRDAEAEPIHHCWEAPDGQIHCDPQKL